ncbi:hypothetical protein cand_015340 [Cryptosporidium andersoni]|uniref:Uncharacterized protein n=1 Tax=Cryptosporidium andersoni TaxID=117008 RepID=A0A1J4MU75_9CRYT|nr:hypothetical protein cand_015340 [Cryptosporidium andersoni]
MDIVTLVSAQHGLYSLDVNNGHLCKVYKDSTTSRGGASYFGESYSYIAAFQQNKAVLHIWNVTKSEPIYKAAMPEVITSCTFQKDGGILYAGGTTGTLYVWVMSTGHLAKCWLSHFKSINKIRLIRNDSLLVTSADDGYIQAYYLSDIFSNKNIPSPLARWPIHCLPVRDFVPRNLASNLFEFFLISIGSDRTINVLSFQKNRPLATVVLPYLPSCCEISYCDNYIIIGTNNGEINIIGTENIKNSDLSATLKLIGHTGTVKVCQLANNRLVSSANDGIRIWDITSQTSLLHLPQFGASIISIINSSLQYKDNENYTLYFRPFQKILTNIECMNEVNITLKSRKLNLIKNINNTLINCDLHAYYYATVAMARRKLTGNLDLDPSTGRETTNNLRNTPRMLIQSILQRHIDIEIIKSKSIDITMNSVGTGWFESKIHPYNMLNQTQKVNTKHVEQLQVDKKTSIKKKDITKVQKSRGELRNLSKAIVMSCHRLSRGWISSIKYKHILRRTPRQRASVA